MLDFCTLQFEVCGIEVSDGEWCIIIDTVKKVIELTSKLSWGGQRNQGQNVVKMARFLLLQIMCSLMAIWKLKRTNRQWNSICRLAIKLVLILLLLVGCFCLLEEEKRGKIMKNHDINSLTLPKRQIYCRANMFWRIQQSYYYKVPLLARK